MDHPSGRRTARALGLLGLALFFSFAPAGPGRGLLGPATPRPAEAESSFLGASELTGRVVGVLDGDTIEVLLPNQRTLRVRLAGIDAPEAGQPHGTRAKRALSALVFGKTVRIEPVDTDDYGRTVAHVLVGGEDASAAMVRDGHAWVYRRYSTDPRLLDLEAEARRAQRGLWALARSLRVPPWEWRHRSSVRAARGAPAARARSRERPPFIAAKPGLETRSGDPDTEGPVVANRRSGVYHWPGCPGYGAVSARNRLVFDSRRAAEAAGFRPARNCP